LASIHTVPDLVALRVLPVIVAPVLPGLMTLQTIFLFVALAGDTVPVSVSGAPNGAAFGKLVISVTGIKAALAVEELIIRKKPSINASKAVVFLMLFCALQNLPD
jgi:hypothetical protein